VAVLVCALGDLLLDVVVRLGRPLAEGDDTTAITRAGAGGQAANVAAWAAALGAGARFIGKRATDTAGELVAAELAAYGVEVLGPAIEGRNGVVVSLVEADGSRTMVSDRGVAPDLRPEELEMRWLAGCAALHLTGYSLLRAPIDEAGAKAAGAARAQGALVSVDLSSANGIRMYGPDRFVRRLELLAPDVIFANESERDVLGGRLPAPTRVLKRGPAGAVIERDGERLELPAASAEVLDSTGAGDALAAGFLVGGPELAMKAAAQCVARLGTMP
jgi:sugar/nucleoside kinase (ribokinase family)